MNKFEDARMNKFEDARSTGQKEENIMGKIRTGRAAAA